jgi:hypothetical protein
MSTHEILAATAFLEGGLCLLAVAGAGLVLARARRATEPLDSRPLTQRWEADLTPAREAACLVAILAAAVLVRTLGWDRPLTLPYWFAETTPLYVADLLERGVFLEEWRRLATLYQQTEPHLSAVMLPVAAAFQGALGSSLHLATLVGAFWGCVAVLLGWALGRMAEGKLFGLGFAAFLAASPLQLAWSRIGGITIGASAWVLLVLACSYAAGRRRSIALAALAGALAWCSLYFYYPARLSIPLAFVALACGARAAGGAVPMSGAGAAVPMKGRALPLAGVLAAAFGGVYALAGAGLKETFWPEYAGYVGNKGEQSWRELVLHNLAPVAEQLGKALRVYFTSYRCDVLDETGLAFGMRHGGASLAPIALLALAGLTVALRSPFRHALWLALVAGGFAVPLLSVATPRRMIVFDAGMCALASLGLWRLVAARPLRALSSRASQAFVALFFAGLGAWSFATVVLLHRTAANVEAVTSMPFANAAWINDGRSCWRCSEAAHAWQAEIAAGGFVVLFDGDPFRENRTTPGGLPLYGKLAALAAGRPTSFVEFYPTVRNFDIEPPRVGAVFDEAQQDFAEVLVERMEAARPAEIVWHFEMPTQWERRLAERLAAAGGLRSEFETPLAATPGVRVVTPWVLRAGAFALLRELAAGPPAPAAGVALHEVASRPSAGSPLELAPPPGGAPVSDWIVRSWREIRFGDFSAPVPHPGPDVIGFTAAIARDGRRRVEYVTRGGVRTSVREGEPPREEPPLPVPNTAGPHCAAHVGGRWWVVDPVSGSLTRSEGSGWRVEQPDAHWVGIARGPRDELVLASSDPQIHVFDLRQGEELRRFPALVWPSLAFVPGECVHLAAWEEGYMTLDPLRSRLALYDRDGAPLALVKLRERLGLTTHRLVSLAAAGRRLAIGIDADNLVKTFEIRSEAAGN